MQKFDITYFHGPFDKYIDNPSVVADIAAAGITLVPLNGSTESNKRALPVLDKFGLQAVVQDPRISNVYYSDSISGADEVVREVVKDYSQYGNIIGWDIVDEPNSSKFPVLAAIVNAFRRYSPDKETVINLFPNYASAEQLGNPDYLSHLEAFVNIVRPHFISYDHYHFLGRENRVFTNDESISERERLIRLSAETVAERGGFFENIRDVRGISLKYGIDAMLIVLLTEHGPYRNLTRGELFWEVNMCLAYGMRRLSYFTYWEPSSDSFWQWTNAMCDTEGKKQRHWYDVQAINKAVRPIGEYLFSHKSTAVFHIGAQEAGAESFTGYGKVREIEGKSGVAGFFDDGSIYLVNKDYISEGKFKIRSDEALNAMRDGIFTPLVEDEITLGPGEAVLLR